MFSTLDVGILTACWLPTLDVAGSEHDLYIIRHNEEGNGLMAAAGGGGHLAFPHPGGILVPTVLLFLSA